MKAGKVDASINCKPMGTNRVGQEMDNQTKEKVDQRRKNQANRLGLFIKYLQKFYHLNEKGIFYNKCVY